MTIVLRDRSNTTTCPWQVRSPSLQLGLEKCVGAVAGFWGEVVASWSGLDVDVVLCSEAVMEPLGAATPAVVIGGKDEVFGICWRAQ